MDLNEHVTQRHLVTNNGSIMDGKQNISILPGNTKHVITLDDAYSAPAGYIIGGIIITLVLAAAIIGTVLRWTKNYRNHSTTSHHTTGSRQYSHSNRDSHQKPPNQRKNGRIRKLLKAYNNKNPTATDSNVKHSKNNFISRLSNIRNTLTGDKNEWTSAEQEATYRDSCCGNVAGKNRIQLEASGEKEQSKTSNATTSCVDIILDTNGGVATNGCNGYANLGFVQNEDLVYESVSDEDGLHGDDSENV